jgi:prophage regulatory protein
MTPSPATRGQLPTTPPMPGRTTDRFLRITEVAETVGLARTTIYRYIHEHGFPSPIPLGGQRVAWLESEVRTWMQNRVAQRPESDKTSELPPGSNTTESPGTTDSTRTSPARLRRV